MKRFFRRLTALERELATSPEGPDIIILKGVDPNDPRNEDAGSAAALFVGQTNLMNKSFPRRSGETMREFVARAQAAFDAAG